MNNFNNLIDGLAEYNFTLNQDQLAQFEKYYELLVEKNKVMNLTAITEWDEVVEKHFLDSLAVIQVLPDLLAAGVENPSVGRGLYLLDLGTGAGFPGIPLKIAFPALKVTLADSLKKRVNFLESTIEEIGLKNISAMHGRAENIARMPEHRECYDYVLSRAVANLSTLAEYCLPFVRVGGHFVAYKSMDCDREVKEAETAVRLLGGEITEVKKFRLGESGRAFVVIEKRKLSPKRYPRKAGIPSKEPLTKR